MSVLPKESKMYIILTMAKNIKDAAAGDDEKKSEYQISSRIYANAFASMMQYGCMPTYIVKNDMALLILNLDGHQYDCPARTIKNILKSEFSAFESALDGLTSQIASEEAKLSNNGQKKKKKRPIENVTPAMKVDEQKTEDDKKEIPPATSLHPPKDTPDTKASVASPVIQAEANEDIVEVAKPESVVIDDPVNVNSSDKSADVQPVDKNSTGISNSEAGIELIELTTVEDDTSLTNVDKTFTRVPHLTENPIEKSDIQKGEHRFKKKESQPQAAATEVDHTPTPEIQEVREEKVFTESAEKPASTGLLSRFLPKSKAQKKTNAAEPVITQNTTNESAQLTEIPQHQDETPGCLIRDIHYVTLKKTYGTQIVGPYVFHVWPTEVIEMYPDRAPSNIFVRVQAPNGEIVSKTSDGKVKYIMLSIDDKWFNICGYWENGVFKSEVTTINKTASIYTKTEQIEQSAEASPKDSMLDQFRSAEPRRPEFFVAPLDAINHGLSSIPIAAYARVNGKNYAITNKGNENTLKFSYSGEVSEISGHWVDGRFSFDIATIEEPNE